MHLAQYRGASSEYKAAALFSSQGWSIFWTPNGFSSCDFIMISGGEIKKVQVKTAHWCTRNNSRFLRSTIRASKEYIASDFDLMIIVDPDGRMWAIPYEHIPTTSNIYLEKRKDGEVVDYGRSKWMVKT